MALIEITILAMASHIGRSSGAIRESYRQNPDKYFADNYEEFHQNNIDSPDDYANRYSEDSGYSAPRQGYQSRQGQSSRSYRPSQSYDDGYERSGDRYQDGYERSGYGSQDAYGRSGDSYRPNENYDRAVQNESYSTANQNPKQEKPQSKGAVERIKGFNLFGSSNESEKDISDREFDDAIDQAMQNMEGSIKFQPNAKNDNMSYESYSPDGFENDFDYSSPHQHNDYGRKAIIVNMRKRLKEDMIQGIPIITGVMITGNPIPEAPNSITILKDIITGIAITEALMIIILIRGITENLVIIILAVEITEILMIIILKEELMEIPIPVIDLTGIPILAMELMEIPIPVMNHTEIPIITKTVMQAQIIINQAVRNLENQRIVKILTTFLQNILKRKH